MNIITEYNTETHKWRTEHTNRDFNYPPLREWRKCGHGNLYRACFSGDNEERILREAKSSLDRYLTKKINNLSRIRSEMIKASEER